ncbi:MAG: hypothetical protein H6678_07985 [Candidatus Delongbacteria bacterium]|nr:hypothetical protein [Candidatus Delongbacteria bacterium]
MAQNAVRTEMMNRDQWGGRWAQLKGLARMIRGNLTHNEYQRVLGSTVLLLGIMQQHVGDRRAVQKAKLDNF